MNYQPGQKGQNQNPQAGQNFAQAQNYANNTKFETGSELTQSTGEISRILATQKLVGLEIGSLGQQVNQNQYQNQQNQNQYQNQNYQGPQNYLSNAQLEVDQAAGPISQNLSQQSQR
ncbi:MAG: hypothetical protein GX081_02315 [Firmicutes bacterium]|nr:hypothetical protein [Bacillota bacterium]